jgi:peptidoglycan hydrolase CwlO-like protein
MPYARRHLRTLAIAAAATAAVLGTSEPSAGDLQSQIQAKQSAAGALKAAIAQETKAINATTGGLNAAQARLTAVQRELTARETQLRNTQDALIKARDHLVELENRLQRATIALSANLVAGYENNQPDLVTVILESHGFSDLLERVRFMQQIRHQDAQIVAATRTSRTEVARQAQTLAALEIKDRALTTQVLGQRNQVAALQAALLQRKIQELGARANKTSQLGALDSQLKKLEAKAQAQAQAAAATGNASVGGIAVNTGGMVQPPAGAPAAVGQVMAAGNAIATLPYVWGGGHGSFQASGYDCSGSVSYALAAAGLLSSPLDSTGFESWGAPGPGQWITVYANSGHAFMVVAGWRFDTVALSQGGTRWSQSMTDTSGYVARHPPGL